MGVTGPTGCCAASSRRPGGSGSRPWSPPRPGSWRRARADLAMGADAVLDDRAKQAYRRRLEALDREVADAEDQGDPDRAEKVRSEREA